MIKRLLLPSAVLCASVSAFYNSAAVAQDGAMLAKTYSFQNKLSSKCMGLIIDKDLSLLNEVAWRGEVRGCDYAVDATKTQRYYLVDQNGNYYNGTTPSGIFTIRPVSHNFEKCMHHVWGSDYRFDACNGSVNQKFQFISKGNDEYWIKAQTSDGLTQCMSNLLGSDAVSGENCSDFFTGSRIKWKLNVRDADHYAVNVPGLGGDPAFINHLRDHGIALNNINNYTLGELRLALSSADHANEAIIYRGKVKNNLFDGPQPGFRVCTHNTPFGTGNTITGVNGLSHACAYTDVNGDYTLIGLPKNRQVTAGLTKEGYLQLAYTMKITHQQDYEQEYVGSATDFFAAFTYMSDPRYEYSSGYRSNGNKNYGEMAFTIINESRPTSDPLNGLISEGMYLNNGVDGVTFTIWTDPNGDGVFDTPYKDTEYNALSGPQDQGDGIADGMFYTGSLAESINNDTNGVLNPLLDTLADDPTISPLIYEKEFPLNYRTETQYFGLAMVTHMTPGIYEVEAHHSTLNCRTTKDAWPAGNSHRGRFEVVKNMMGDVRWYCVP